MKTRANWRNDSSRTYWLDKIDQCMQFSSIIWIVQCEMWEKSSSQSAKAAIPRRCSFYMSAFKCQVILLQSVLNRKNCQEGARGEDGRCNRATCWSVHLKKITSVYSPVWRLFTAKVNQTPIFRRIYLTSFLKWRHSFDITTMDDFLVLLSGAQFHRVVKCRSFFHGRYFN